jgi:Ribosomal protein L3
MTRCAFVPEQSRHHCTTYHAPSADPYIEARLQVYKVGKKGGDHGARTDFDPTDKPITPMGGFVGYGAVNEDYVLIKARGCLLRCVACAAGSEQVLGGR